MSKMCKIIVSNKSKTLRNGTRHKLANHNNILLYTKPPLALNYMALWEQQTLTQSNMNTNKSNHMTVGHISQIDISQ